MGAYSLTSIIQLLNPDNTISAHRLLAHSIGMKETIIYSALISKQTYYSQNGMLHEGGWFYSTICDLQESTTFAAKAQKTAIKHLVEYGLIECEYKGLPAKRFFRIVDDTDNLIRLINVGVNKSQEIINNSKEQITEKANRRSNKKVESIRTMDSQEDKQTTVQEGIPCSVPPDTSCSYREAGTSTSPTDNKTKDNYKPKENNLEIFPSVDQSGDRKKEKQLKSVENANFMSAKFSDVLKKIGIDWYLLTPFEPNSERSFRYSSEEDRHVSKCIIPYDLKNDKRSMKAALRYLCCYSYYFNDNKDEERRVLWETIICALTELVENDSVVVQNKRVMYYEIIDRLNEIIKQSSLADCFISFESKWTAVIANKEVKFPRAYLKSCIWNWLCDYEFEDYVENVKFSAKYVR